MARMHMLAHDSRLLLQRRPQAIVLPLTRHGCLAPRWRNVRQHASQEPAGPQPEETVIDASELLRIVGKGVQQGPPAAVDPYKEQEGDPNLVVAAKQVLAQHALAQAKGLEREEQLLESMQQLNPGNALSNKMLGKVEEMMARNRSEIEQLRQNHIELLRPLYGEGSALELAAAVEKLAGLQEVLAVAAKEGPQQEEDLIFDPVIESREHAGMWVSANVTTALLSAGTLAFVGSLVGLQATRQLVLPAEGSWASFAAWTAPYVVGTVAYYLQSDKSGGRYRVVRDGISPRLLPLLSLPTLVGVAAAFSFCQCLIYQGMWQDAVLRWQTGLVPPDTLAIEELLQPDGAPQLPLARLVALALSVGAVETICSTFRRQTLGEFAAIARAPTRGGWDEATQSDSFVRDDIWLTAARVALSGTWLAAETAASGSLWLAVGTSTAGLLAGLLIAQAQEVVRLSGGAESR